MGRLKPVNRRIADRVPAGGVIGRLDEGSHRVLSRQLPHDLERSTTMAKDKMALLELLRKVLRPPEDALMEAQAA